MNDLEVSKCSCGNAVRFVHSQQTLALLISGETGWFKCDSPVFVLHGLAAALKPSGEAFNADSEREELQPCQHALTEEQR